MAPEDGDRRLFGAAVLLRRLEESGLKARGSEVFEGVLEDLDVSEGQVRRYLEDHLEEIDRALKLGKAP